MTTYYIKGARGERPDWCTIDIKSTPSEARALAYTSMQWNYDAVRVVKVEEEIVFEVRRETKMRVTVDKTDK